MRNDVNENENGNGDFVVYDFLSILWVHVLFWCCFFPCFVLFSFLLEFFCLEFSLRLLPGQGIFFFKSGYFCSF